MNDSSTTQTQLVCPFVCLSVLSATTEAADKSNSTVAASLGNGDSAVGMVCSVFASCFGTGRSSGEELLCGIR